MNRFEMLIIYGKQSGFGIELRFQYIMQLDIRGGF